MSFHDQWQSRNHQDHAIRDRCDALIEAALNAADEIAVAAFLKREIAFADIPKAIRQTMDETELRHPESIEEVLATDAQARELARHKLSRQLTR